MSLDSANKVNIDLQKTVKRQSLQLTEIQAHYDEIQRQLQVTLDQLSVASRRVQALTAEAEEIRSNYEGVSLRFWLENFGVIQKNFRLFAAKNTLNNCTKKPALASTN